MDFHQLEESEDVLAVYAILEANLPLLVLFVRASDANVHVANV